MKKRILALIFVVAMAVLSAGCSNTNETKPVEDREDFFSSITGMYVESNSYGEYVQTFKDGSFLVSTNISTESYENGTPSTSHIECYCIKGSFQMVYKDNDYSYHASISKLTPNIVIINDINHKNNKNQVTVIFPSKKEVSERFSTLFINDLLKDICSNDIFTIYFPGTPNTFIPLLNEDDTKAIVDYESNDQTYFTNDYYDFYPFDPYDYDKNHDGKLDYNLLFNTNTEHSFKPTKSDYQIEKGIWIDYISEAPLIKVYNFKNGSVEVERYSLSNKSITPQESESKNNDPYFFVALEKSIIMINDKTQKHITLKATGDKNRVMILADSSNYSGIKRDYSLYYYSQMPDYYTLVKDSAKAETELTKTTK